MKYVDEFRDEQRCRILVQDILRTTTRRRVLMEVCGGQTHGLLRHGIPEALRESVELIHGPGCPVCVTPPASIDRVQQLAMHPEVLVTVFGDMLRVPGSRATLQEIRSQGGRVQTVWSPLDAVSLAAADPSTHVVFFAVGFETTTPATALAVLQAAALRVSNFSLLTAHVRVLPAMQGIASSAENRVEAFLAAGHVCAVTGTHAYHDFSKRTGIPIVVTGFEPTDLLEGILECVRQLESGQAQVSNRYRRAVRDHGNLHAQQIVDRVFEIADQEWRGLGTIPRGGLQLRPEFARFDAIRRFGEYLDLTVTRSAGCSLPEDRRCRAGDILTGRLAPASCPEFGSGCTPEHPLGAPMVSSEGACAAWFRYGVPQDGNTTEAATAGRSGSPDVE